MADIVTSTLQIGSNNLILRDADAQAKVAVNTQDISSLKEDFIDSLITDTASGAIASFPDGADGVPVKSLTVDAESGHTQAVVTRTGFNVWDEEWEIGDIDTTTGQNKASTRRLRSKNYISIKPNTSYYMGVDVTQTITWLIIVYYDANKSFLSYIAPYKNNAFTTPSNAVYMRFVLPDTWNGADYVGGISINYPSTDHDYHAYNGQQYIIDLNSGSTETNITTLKGQNNIWADIGDVEVEYRADTKLYIEKLTVPTEDDMIVDHAISSGSFFMVGNTLYRATTAIASGATITVGTNATKLSLSEALNALA